MAASSVRAAVGSNAAASAAMRTSSLSLKTLKIVPSETFGAAGDLFRGHRPASGTNQRNGCLDDRSPSVGGSHGAGTHGGWHKATI